MEIRIWIDRVGERQGAQIKAFARFLGLKTISVGAHRYFEYGSNAGGWDGVTVRGEQEEMNKLFDATLVNGQEWNCYLGGPWREEYCEARGWKKPEPVMVTVPEGKILVEEYSYNVQGYGTRCGYTVVKAGEKVTPAKLREGTLLGEGEETKVTVSNHLGRMHQDYLLRNKGGEAEVVMHPDEIASRKNFAREQIAKLRDLGFRDKTAVAIMKAAGPGRCVAAAEWAKDALKTVMSFSDDTDRGAAVDALDMILGGIGGTHGFGKDRTVAALKALGIEPPSIGSSRVLMATLAGARAALVGGIPEPEDTPRYQRDLEAAWAEFGDPITGTWKVPDEPTV